MNDYEYLKRLKLISSEYSNIKLEEIYKEYSALQVMLEMREVKNTKNLVQRVLNLEQKQRDMELWVDNIWMLTKLFGTEITAEMLDATPYDYESLQCNFIKHNINVGRNGTLVYNKYFPHWDFITDDKCFKSVYEVMINSKRNGITLYTEMWDEENDCYNDGYTFLGLNGDIIKSKGRPKTSINIESDLVVRLV